MRNKGFIEKHDGDSNLFTKVGHLSVRGYSFDYVDEDPEPIILKDEVSALDIGKGVVEYVNKLKHTLEIALNRAKDAEMELTKVGKEAVKLTGQVHDLQGACNKMKMNGGISRQEIFGKLV